VLSTKEITLDDLLITSSRVISHNPWVQSSCGPLFLRDTLVVCFEICCRTFSFHNLSLSVSETIYQTGDFSFIQPTLWNNFCCSGDLPVHRYHPFFCWLYFITKKHVPQVGMFHEKRTSKLLETQISQNRHTTPLTRHLFICYTISVGVCIAVDPNFFASDCRSPSQGSNPSS